MRPESHRIPARAIAVALAAALSTVACRQDMHDQPRYEALEASMLFRDQRSARPLVEGTVALGQLDDDPHLHRGTVDGKLATTFPSPVTATVMQRGQERYNIFCAPCHDRAGSGNGIIVRRGLRAPPSFHTERLREVAIGHFVDVETRGFGIMPSYASRIPPADRWAIAAYIRALQLSQGAIVDDLPPEIQSQDLRRAP